jgi:MarR family transcriptional regulator, organic hydroperoxide resistance regulator
LAVDEKVMEVVRLLNRFRGIRMREAFEPWRTMDVPLAQLKSLFLIQIKGPASVRSLALDLGVTPANVTGIIDRLVAQELVTRAESASDRRSVRLELTDKGRAKIASIQDVGARRLPRVLRTLRAGDLDCLVSGLGALVAAFERERAQAPASRAAENPPSPSPAAGTARKTGRLPSRC